jgi:hypothetical protein
MSNTNLENDLAPRACLRCGKVFETDRWHRICKRCHNNISRRYHGGALNRAAGGCKVSDKTVLPEIRIID